VDWFRGSRWVIAVFYEAIRRIRAGTGGRNARILAVTASAFEEDRREVLATGADDFLGKPFREGTLFDKIGALLDLRWACAGDPRPTPGLQPTGTSTVPAALGRALRLATMSADLDRMLELLVQIEREAPEAARRLRALAEGFAYQQILDQLPVEEGEP
jgi:DNA-binding response OmpR family regulator